MGITTFDTLKFVRRLEEVGVPSGQAEVQAEVLTEAFQVNLEELVTKDYLESRLDVRFAEQRAYIDTRFAEERAHKDSQFAEVRGNFRTLYWMNGLIILVTVAPALQRMLSF